MERGELISQLRTALALAESPQNEVVEFEIGDTGFSFEFEKGSPEETGA